MFESASSDVDSSRLSTGVFVVIGQRYDAAALNSLYGSCLLSSTTARNLQERVTELLRRVVVDDGIDTRVEVSQTIEQHSSRHVRTTSRQLVEEEIQQVDVDRQPQ